MNLQELVATATPPSNINANALDVVVASDGDKWGAAWFDGIKARQPLIVGGLTPSKVHKVIEALKGPGSAYAEVKAELDRFVAARTAARAEEDEAYDKAETERKRIAKLNPAGRRKAAKAATS